MTLPRTLFLFLALSLAATASAQDVVSVGNVTATGTTVDVPVYIRDAAGTSLGMDRPAGSRIQSFSIKVNYSPASAVASVTFTRSGITAGHNPKSEFAPASAGSISLLDTFSETTDLLPFSLNANLPGDEVAHLVFTLSASAAPGAQITLALDPLLTQLTDEGGTGATKESAAGGTLGLSDGSITIPVLTLALTPSLTSVDVNGTTSLTATLSANATAATTVSLASSDSAVATVPASEVIAAGSRSAVVTVAGVKPGSASITASVPSGSGNATASATVHVVPPGASLFPSVQTVSVGSTGTLTFTITTAQAAPMTVTVTSSDPAIVTVPGTVELGAGALSTTFTIDGLKAGSASVIAVLPAENGGAASSALVNVSTNCATPVAPQISASSPVASGTSFNVTWTAVSGATEYVVEESTDTGFAGATSRTVTASPATFVHSSASDVRYSYRVRARNRGGSCERDSPLSNVVSVLVTAAVGPQTRFLAVVGSTAGSFGSFFKTSLQLFNPKSTTISGKLVFHPANASGSSSDPSIAYSLAPGKTLVYADFLPAMSRTGLGTVDVVADVGSSFPVMLARVFNDAGAAGTTGLTEETLSSDDALQAGMTGTLLGPVDIEKFRINLGIRTLESGASLTITVRDKDGLVAKTVEKTFGPTFFTQVGSAALLDGFALTGGETLSFRVNAGSAFVYGATTDNTTNDPSVQFARRTD